MFSELAAADMTLLDLLRKQPTMSIGELAGAMEVTATAVRQRLGRLMGLGLIERKVARAGRGRPSHRYELTQEGRRRSGANFADLAVALWQEIREIRDPEVRRGLLQRVSKRLAQSYASSIGGANVDERMESLAAMFRDRRIPFEVDRAGELPVLNALACPYPELAEQDRSICAMERLLFQELVGDSLKLSHCRLDGDSCCQFQTSGGEV